MAVCFVIILISTVLGNQFSRVRLVVIASPRKRVSRWSAAAAVVGIGSPLTRRCRGTRGCFRPAAPSADTVYIRNRIQRICAAACCCSIGGRSVLYIRSVHSIRESMRSEKTYIIIRTSLSHTRTNTRRESTSLKLPSVRTYTYYCYYLIRACL